MFTSTMIQLLLVLVAALCPGIYCFVQPTSNNVAIRNKLQPPTRACNNIVSERAALAPSAVATSSSTKQTSGELLRLLIRKADVPKEGDALNNQINSLVQALISSKSSFNPTTCIDGPLFASIHFIGNTPLWEKISAGAVRNIKGQKYTLDDNSFTNYAEIWGDNLCLQAVGKFSEIGPVQAVVDENNPFSSITSLFANKQSSLLPTPYDYEARVTGASISLWNKFTLNLTIEGTGTVRVLYADENLRIFLSPTDTNVTKGAGDWESEGLIVVQVCVGLVYDDWVDNL
mmetsp:Transcript_26226/g.52798  ORF Transcript_26226/g.52798 Transcript_26226/m.52798 type:complete len:288 (-) Transcript_26226:1210-2073(-)